MLTIQTLKTYGANTEEGLTRCFGNEALYLRLVSTIPDEKHFDNLDRALKANDLAEAFEAAHALKGVLGNLSLTPLYEPMSEITELLRTKTEMDYGTLYNRILQKKEELKSLCEI